MSTVLKMRRGTTAEHASFTGLQGEVTVNTTTNSAVVHDGVTAGGHALAKKSGDSFALAAGAAATPSISTTGDPNTGIYFPAADTVGIATGGIANVQFSGGSSPRITGDFSNATVANRVTFQTSITNGNTTVGALHAGGTATAAQFAAYGSVDPDNSSIGTLTAVGGADIRLQSTKSGSGTYLPMTFYTGGSERMRIDSSGNVLVTNVAGLGYGTGAGGSVIQATSKYTAVTLNKPCGKITTAAGALAANTTAAFTFTNSLIGANDVVVFAFADGNGYQYNVWPSSTTAGSVSVNLRNITGGSLAQALPINFAIIKGSAS
jgi:hypothetical protein